MSDPFLHRRRFLEAYEQLVISLGGWQRAGIPRSTWYSLRRMNHVPYEATLTELLQQRAQAGNPATADDKARLYALRRAAQREREENGQCAVPDIPRRIEEIAQTARDIITRIEYFNHLATHGDPYETRVYRVQRDELIARHIDDIAAAGLWDELVFWGERILDSTATPERHPDIFQRLVDAYARRGQWTAAERLLTVIEQIAGGGCSQTFAGVAHTIRAEYELIRSLHGFSPAFYEAEHALNEARALLKDQRPHLFAALLALGRIRRRYTDRGAIESFVEVANDQYAPYHAEWASLAAGNLSIVQYHQRHFRKTEVGLRQAWKGIHHLRDLTEVYTVQASVHFQRGDMDKYLMWRIRGEQLTARMRLIHPLSSTHAELIRLSGQERVIAPRESAS